MSGRGILDADMQTIGGWLTGAVRWWLEELLSLVPQRVRDRLKARTTLVDYRPGTGALWPRTEGVVGRGPISVVLPPDLCLVRTIAPPQMNARDLAAMLALDGDRIMPFGDGAMILAARIIARHGEGGRMAAEVAGLPRDSAKTLAEVLRLAARTPAHVLVSPPDPSGPLPIDMLPALRRAGLTGGRDRSGAALWLTVGFLFMLNIGLLIWRDSASVDALYSVVAQQQPAVAAAHRIVGRMRAVDTVAADTLVARRGREPLAMLVRIDRALPEGAWLQRLSWQGDAVRMTGFRAPRTDVSAALRRAGLGVLRYDDSSTTAQTPFGQPFDITIRAEQR